MPWLIRRHHVRDALSIYICSSFVVRTSPPDLRLWVGVIDDKGGPVVLFNTYFCMKKEHMIHPK